MVRRAHVVRLRARSSAPTRRENERGGPNREVKSTARHAPSWNWMNPSTSEVRTDRGGAMPCNSPRHTRRYRRQLPHDAHDTHHAGMEVHVAIERIVAC
jgi:hypothetical protein